MKIDAYKAPFLNSGGQDVSWNQTVVGQNHSGICAA